MSGPKNVASKKLFVEIRTICTLLSMATPRPFQLALLYIVDFKFWSQFSIELALYLPTELGKLN